MPQEHVAGGRSTRAGMLQMPAEAGKSQQKKPGGKDRKRPGSGKEYAEAPREEGAQCILGNNPVQDG